jgi:ribonuclease HI
MEKITLNFDGSCEPINPGGRMGFGVFITQNGKVLHEEGIFAEASPLNSNNVAEYMALCNGLQWLVDNGYSEAPIDVAGDSMLVIKQLSGEWRAKGGMYYSAFTKACQLRDQFTNISFRWIGRDKNAEADARSRVAGQ